MKRAFLILAAMGCSLAGFSQDRFVVSANVALQSGNLDEAKGDIDKAMANAETAEKPKALFVKANIYMALQQAGDKYATITPYRDCAEALMKLAEIKPDYEKSSVNQNLISCSTHYYNDAIRAYKNEPPKYTEAEELMGNVVKIYNLNGGKRFGSEVDTNKANANRVIANCYFYSGQYDAAIPLLIQVKDNPITKTPTAYENLIEAYDKTKKTQEELAVINEGRAAFPDNQILVNDELNYYIVTGKQDELMKKLEESVAKDPGNAEFQYILATAYTGMANPKGGGQPKNKEELLTKAESAFKAAIKVSPDNTDYNYNFGALYFNEAKSVNDQMAAITGSSAAEMKKYDDLKVKRDGLFDKAQPYLDKAYTVLDAKAGTLKDNDRKIYLNSMQALTQIYAIESKMDKVQELKKKMDAVR